MLKLETAKQQGIGALVIVVITIIAKYFGWL